MDDRCMERTNNRKKKNRRIRAVICAAAVIAGLVFLISCKSSDEGEPGIRILISEQTMQDGTIIQIPEFKADREETQKNIRDLEKETKNLQKMVDKAQRRGKHMEMRCYLNEEKNYPQVTVVWYTSEEETRLYDLVTLGVDMREEVPITCKEALEKTGLTGVDLSLAVGRLAQESGIRGELTSTEMQGFRLDENGDVREIYMKLILETVTENGEQEEITTTEEQFFSYDPKENKLVRLSEEGFDIP